jgi:uncharacterized protein (DUF1800 family)
MTTEPSFLARVGRVACFLAAAPLAACAARTPAVQSPDLSKGGPPATDSAIVHLLNRAAFGPRPGEVEAVRRIGVRAFVEQQLHPERVDDGTLEARLAELPTVDAPPRMLAEEFVKPAELERKRRQAAQPGVATAAASKTIPDPDPDAFKRERHVLDDLAAQKILRAVASERQLQEVLVDFWFNHFNVQATKGADRLYAGEYERAVIRPRVFGSFRDLLGAVAESPAMLFYLDNWMSVDPNGLHPVRPATAARPGAARIAAAPQAKLPPAARARARTGLNENFARELMELHTLGVDGGYTQHDVTEVARCFTGWTIAGPNDGGGFVFDPRKHDEGRKVVLGHVIEPGGGQRDGERVLDILASHPSTARFIATKLVRRLVADDPPRSLVDRAAARFRETRGDLREVVRTILLSREFASDDARWAKAKTPFEFVVSALRATGARVDDTAPAVNAVRALGMPLYGCLPPTGYPDRADAWMTAGSVLGRMNLSVALASNRLRGIVVDLRSLAPASGAAPAAVAESLLGPDVSASTRAVLARQAGLVDVVALALGSPEFQRR